MISEKVIAQLEFDKALELASSCVYSGVAKELILKIRPADNFDDAKNLIEETYEAYRVKFVHTISISFSFDDVRECISRVSLFSDLSAGEILRVARLLKVSRNIKKTILNINDDSIVILKRIANDLYFDEELENDIFTSIISDTEISDNASARLAEIRKSIKSCNAKIRDKLNSYISGSQNKYLQDNIVTMRMNRYVVPVKSEYRGQVAGLIHDQSSTGATVYIEPMAIVELNNDLKRLAMEEEGEIKRILNAFSERIRPMIELLEINFNNIAYLDCVFAKAEFAYRTRATKPTLNNSGYIKIERGRHPLIEKNRVVPIDVNLGKDYNVLVISGPNTGGKTVTLKLVGLFTLMAMSGFYLPCEDSQMSFFDGVFCDIGDEQSIEASLSTFSSHLTNIIDITNSLTNQSLVLFDELGGGTDPIEGSALAIGVLEHLISKSARCIITSHYNELKEYAFTREGVENASMDFDTHTYAPTYKLLIGVSGVSNAIQIAQRLGLNKSIVEKSKSLLSQEKITFDKILLSAEEARRKAQALRDEQELINREASSKLEDIKILKNELLEQKARLNEQIRRGAKDLLSDYMEEANEIVDKLKSLQNSKDEADLFTARKLKKSLEKMSVQGEDESEVVSKISGEIELGDSVFIISLNTVAEVLKINEKKKEYSVKVGVLTTNVKFNDVYRVKVVGKKIAKATVKTLPFSNVACPAELKLLGQRVDEAIDNVDKYFELATRSSLKEVRIVHGKGTGALRKALHEHFKTSPYVDTFRLANFGEGDAGVTIVSLK